MKSMIYKKWHGLTASDYVYINGFTEKYRKEKKTGICPLCQ